MHYRDRIEIVFEILNTCRTPTIRSHLVTKVNISYNSLLPYLEKLEKLGLLRHKLAEMQFKGKSDSLAYITTPDGVKWIDLIGPWCQIMKRI